MKNDGIYAKRVKLESEENSEHQVRKKRPIYRIEEYPKVRERHSNWVY